MVDPNKNYMCYPRSDFKICVKLNLNLASKDKNQKIFNRPIFKINIALLRIEKKGHKRHFEILNQIKFSISQS